MKKLLPLLLLTAAAPPANVQMLNGQPRAVTPVAIVDANGNQVTSFSGTSTGNSSTAATAPDGSALVSATDGAIVGIGTLANPATGSTNYWLGQIYTRQGASPMQQNGGSVSITGTPSINNAQVAGTAIATGPGASNAGTQRVILATDSPSSATPTGTAGSPNAAVVSVQGVGGGTAMTVNDFGLVSTSAPILTNGNTAQLSLTAAGGLRVDGSAVTQPVSSTTLATAANQVGAGTAAQTIQGATASGVADAGNPVKIGGVYNSTLPTLTTGQRGDVQVDTRGGMLTVIKGTNGTNQAAVSAPSNGASNTFGLVTTSQNTWATASGTWDYAYDLTGATAGAGVGVGAFGMVPTSAVTQGLQPATVASPTSQVVKTSPGNLYSINVDNTAVTGTYVIDYNATAAPTAGATLTASLILWHALLGSGQTLDKAFPVPVYATNGHVLLYSTSLTTFTAPTTGPTVSTVTFK